MAARARMTQHVGRALEVLALMVVLFCVLTPSVAQAAASYSVLYRFTRGADGSQVVAPVIRATDGNFYGTTFNGGAYDKGVVFKLTPTGTLTTLHSFTGGVDGHHPHAALLQAADGNFYGTTWSSTSSGGVGTAFRLTPDGTLTTLHTFMRNHDDGGQPQAALIQGADGNFYGTTARYGPFGFGTVFKLTPSGTLTTLHAFAGGADGAYPNAPLIRGTDGNFYGTTGHGGASSEHTGTVFKITPSGTLTTLHVFTTGAGGAYPYAPLLQGTDGNFYGTTRHGGTSRVGSGYGIIFTLTPSGAFTTLHSFHEEADGTFPEAALIQATNEKLYGTTGYGGTADNGTVFTVTLPLTVTSVTPDKAAPQVRGTTVTFTAKATGGVAPQQCKSFWTTDPTWTTYSELRTWQPCTTAVPWTPTAPGSYQVAVWARSSGNTTEAPEATAGVAMTITPLPVTVTATPASPRVVGTPITLSATVTGGTAPQQCKWFVTTDNWATSSLLRDWQLCSSALSWTPTTAGSYQVGVWVRGSGVTANAPQGTAGLAYAIVAPVPDIRGTYTGSGSATNSGCTNPIDNGVFPFTVTLNIPTQTGATFNGTGTVSGDDGPATVRLAGTVTAAGQVSGTLDVMASLGSTGTLPFTGTVVGRALSISFAGQTHEEGVTCNLSGSFAGTRP